VRGRVFSSVSSVKSSGEPSSFQDLTVFSNQVLTGGVFVG